MKNQQIAKMFESIADILELKGEIFFKVNAYRRASRVINDLQQDIEVLWQEKKLRQLPGIGDALVKKIDEFLTTGHMKKYDEVTSEISAELVALLGIQNLGPKTLALAHNKLGVNNLQDLISTIENGSLAQLPGMGEKKIENIKKGIELFKTGQDRISIGVALLLIEQIISQLKNKVELKNISPAGSVRRMRETVHDIDILAAANDGSKVINTFVNLPQVEQVLAQGDTKGSILVENNVQVDLRVVSESSFGAALQYFTGSQAHNVKLRGIARKRGLKINEYGVFRDDEKLAGAEEAEVYQLLNLPWIAPELREDRGEIEAASEAKLPQLLTLNDIKGDLHVHTTYSDGHATIEQMVQSAIQLGYRYLAICDHSQSVFYAHGLSVERLLKQIDEIDSLNKKFEKFTILKGSEVDILSDGQVDMPDEILAQLDIVVASIHTGFKQNVTDRILAAMENPYIDIIAHPTGRLISKREGYEVDLDKIMRKAAETSKALEINAYPSRLDLSDINARKAIEMGVMLAINTDAHHPDHLPYMKLGVGTARRGWLESKNVLNTMTCEELMNWKRKRND